MHHALICINSIQRNNFFFFLYMYNIKPMILFLFSQSQTLDPSKQQLPTHNDKIWEYKIKP